MLGPAKVCTTVRAAVAESAASMGIKVVAGLLSPDV